MCSHDDTSEKVRHVVENYITRRLRGETLDDDSVVAAHPDLMPELAEALRKARIILAARRQQTTGTDNRGDSNTDRPLAEEGHVAEPVQRAARAGTPPTPTSANVDRYRVRSKIASGAFATVYLAEDSLLDRVVAIKIPRPDSILDADQYIAEARRLAQLDMHPGIVPVYDAGWQEDGTPFVVMQYIRGRSLAELLTHDRPSYAQAAEWIASVADAVAHAHRHGFIHRDLAPKNILLDHDGRCYVADFGLALHQSTQPEHRGDASGTPIYRAPEQVRGEAHCMDGRVDVWALGVVFYEMLTGCCPFAGVDHDELDADILSRNPTPPREIHEEIPEQLQQICLKCLEKSPEDRYLTAESLAQALRQVVSAAGPGQQSTTSRPAGDVRLGPNPYKGLAPFDEPDSDWFFGRESQVRRLLASLTGLYEEPEAVRFLPILGPSGCGKSSLARAGLMAELARQPVRGSEVAPTRILTPGEHPLESLGAVLTGIDTNDPIATADMREAVNSLTTAADSRRYDGLRSIVDLLALGPSTPLVLLVDQFEEVYSLCTSADERFAFIENLLTAARDPSRRIIVVISMRTDFLVATQDHQELNSLICQQGIMVPAMAENELRDAIMKPAELAGYRFDQALVDLLVEESCDREGALPLLQFALRRIWDGLMKRVEPSETLRQMGGVGGALANEAHSIYERLSDDDRRICRRVFLGLVQLGEGTPDTRRRVPVASLVAHTDDLTRVQDVVLKFSSPDARLITLSAEQDGRDMAEVTHESLFHRWQTFKDWIDQGRNDIRFQRRLDDSARHWKTMGCPAGLLWRSPDFDVLRQYTAHSRSELTHLQLEFYRACNRRRQRERLAAGMYVALVVVGLIVSLVLWRRAQNEAERFRRLLYVSDMNMALRAWDAANVGRVDELLKRHVPERNRMDLRGFEWRHLWTLRQRGLNCPSLNHGSPVRSVACSPSGDRLASGGANGTIKIWDVETRTLLHEIRGHRGEVQSLDFSADGTVLASASWDGTARTWDVATGKPLLVLNGHHDAVFCVVFSPDARTLATASFDRTIKLWDATTGREIRTLSGHTHFVVSVAFSSDGRTLASGSYDNTARLWDLGSEDSVILDGHDTWVQSVAFSPSERIVATADWDGGIRIWDASSGEKLRVLENSHHGSVFAIAFSPDGQTLASGSADGTVRLWDVHSGSQVDVFKGHSGTVWSIDFSADGKMVASGSQDNRIKLWSLARARRPLELFRDHGVVMSVAASSDLKYLAAGGRNRTIRVWDMATGSLHCTLTGHQDVVRTIAILPKGPERLASASYDGTIKLWDLSRGSEIVSVKGHAGMIQCMALSPRGRLLASGGWDSTIKLWEATTLKKLATLRGHEGPVAALAFSRDGKTLASGGADYTVKLWDTRSYDLKSTLIGHADWVVSLAFSPSENELASASWDYTIRLWDLASLKTVKELKGHSNWVWSIAYSPDGQTLASGSMDRTVKLWNLATGSEQATFSNGDSGVMSVVYSTDGNTLISGGVDGTVRVRRATAAEQISHWRR